MTKSGYTHVSLAADRSGSMIDIKDDAQGAINQFVKDQKAQPGKVTFTLAQFDTEYDLVYENVDLQSVGDYTLSPRGATALLDAWGKLINTTGQYLAGLPEDERPENVILVIVTDGFENSSKEFTRQQVKQMTDHQRDKYNWQVIFLAANQDAVQVGGMYGVPASHSLTYAATGAGARKSFSTMSGLVSSYRSGDIAVAAAGFTDKDREEAEKE